MRAIVAEPPPLIFDIQLIQASQARVEVCSEATCPLRLLIDRLCRNEIAATADVARAPFSIPAVGRDQIALRPLMFDRNHCEGVPGGMRCE